MFNLPNISIIIPLVSNKANRIFLLKYSKWLPSLEGLKLLKLYRVKSVSLFLDVGNSTPKIWNIYLFITFKMTQTNRFLRILLFGKNYGNKCSQVTASYWSEAIKLILSVDSAHINVSFKLSMHQNIKLKNEGYIG